MAKKILLLFFILNVSLFAKDRVVSIVPSITEILFELGLDKEVVGVSRYCLFDVRFCNREKVGTALDFSYEKILELKANVVLLSKGPNKRQVENLKKLNVEVIELKHDRLKDITFAVKKLGERFKKEKKAFEINSRIKNSLVKQSNASKKKVLFLISSHIKNSKVSKIHAAASDNFYTDILNSLGYRNILNGGQISFPELGREKLLSLKYDYVIEIFGPHNKAQMKAKKEAWRELLVTSKNKFSYKQLLGEHLFIPGPSVWKIASDIKSSLGSN